MSDSAPFDALTRAGQSRRLRIVAERALAAYPVEPVRVVRLATGWNATFAVGAADGSRYVLRVHRPTGPDADMVRSELAWLVAIRRDLDLSVPDPVGTSEGQPLVVIDDPALPGPRTCDLLRWVPGRFVDRRLRPAHLQAVGRLMGLLQNHGQDFSPPPGWIRPRPDEVIPAAAAFEDGLCDDVILECRELVTLAAPEGAPIVVRVLEAVRWARDLVGSHGRILIHADLHQENYLFAGSRSPGGAGDRGRTGSIGAIDFDDCGLAPPIYDLAVTCSEIRHRPDYPALRTALLAGYREWRALPVSHEPAIDTYVAFRYLQLMLERIRDRANPMWRDIWIEETVGTLGALNRLVPA